MDTASYTAAAVLPAKLFCDNGVLEAVRNHKISPVHVQINPTNKCPLKCAFCSCANRETDREMSYDELCAISEKFITLGAKAFTITGGGDPLAHEHIGKYVNWLHSKGVAAALVTNGVLFKNHDLSFIEHLTWCRVSLSDDRDLRPAELEEAIKHKTDWSFSYVLTKPSLPRIIRAIEFANEHNFTHIRIVDDIINNLSTTMDRIRRTIEDNGIDCGRVIWQGRKTYTRGHKRCLVSLLRPNVDIYGNLTGCCGIQYASNPPALDFTRAFRVCDAKGIEKAYQEQKYFDGSICERCYYSDYNEALNAMWNAGDLHHQEFL
jgi:organic radical activating enzyme